jgi:hypothetical protein
MTLRRSTGFVNKLNGIKTNIVVNGTFDPTATSWVADNATLSVTANTLTITNAGAVAGGASQDLVTVPGRVYKFTALVAGGTGTAHMSAGVGGNSPSPESALVSPVLTGAESLRSFAFVAATNVTRITLGVTAGVAGATATFKDIKVEEVVDGFQEIFRGCKIAVFSGVQPASADDSKNGTLLYTVTKDGLGVEGLTWGDSSNGVIAKTVGEVWRGTAVASGNAGWFRCYESGDDPLVSSTSKARFDGAISTSGGEITMSNVAVELDAVQSLSVCSYASPRG